MSCGTWVVFCRRTGSGCRVGAVVVSCVASFPCCRTLMMFGGFMLSQDQVAQQVGSASTLLVGMMRSSLNLLSRCGGTGGYLRGETPAAHASPPDWPRRGDGGSLGQRDWGSENAGIKAKCLLYHVSPMTLWQPFHNFPFPHLFLFSKICPSPQQCSLNDVPSVY